MRTDYVCLSYTVDLAANGAAVDIELSSDQLVVFKKANAWIETTLGGGSGQLAIGGYAGTGKTTVLGCLAKKWQHRRIAYVAYTGRAVVNLRKSLEAWKVPFETKLKGNLLGAYCGTMHSLIYFPCVCREATVGTANTSTVRQTAFSFGTPTRCSCGGSGFIRNHSRPPFDLIVCDEASMVNGDMAADLESYGIPIIYVGDHGQLPPIGGKSNKMARPDLRLEKIHRQAEGNPIIRLADEVRRTGRVSKENMESLADGKHVIFAKRGTLNAHLQDLAKRASNHMRTTLVSGLPAEGTVGFAAVCHTNAMRLSINRVIRKYRQGGDYDPAVQNGDYIIALRNHPPIFNGMRGIVEQVLSRAPFTTELFIRFDDLPRSGAVRSLNVQFNREKTFANKLEIDRAIEAAGLEVPEYGLHADLLDFGYALTCHKAQGSQFDTVLLYPDGRMDPNEDDTKRWLYTAVTRAKARLIYLT
jgi:exodeoxyribonuclease-5